MSQFVSEERADVPVLANPSLRPKSAEFYTRPIQNRPGAKYPMVPHIIANVEAICSRFQGVGEGKAGEGYLLSDGTGTGKSTVVVEVADMMRNVTGKPSLVVVKDEQSVTQGIEDVRETGLVIPPGGVIYTTYDQLPNILASHAPDHFGVIACDEAHVLSQPENKETVAALKSFHGGHLYVSATATASLDNILLFQDLVGGVPPDVTASRLGLEKRPDGKFAVNDPDLFVSQLYKAQMELVKEGAASQCEFPLWGQIDSIQVTAHQLTQGIDLESSQEAIARHAIATHQPIATTEFQLQALAEYSRAWQVSEDVCEKIRAGEAVILYGNDREVSCPALTDDPFHGEIPSFAETVRSLVEERAALEPGLAQKLGEVTALVYPEVAGDRNSTEIAKFRDRNSALIIVPLELNEGINSLNDQDKVKHRPVSVFVAGLNPDLPLGSALVQMYGRAFRMNSKSPSLGRLYTTEGAASDEVMSTELRQSLEMLKIGGSGIAEAIQETIPKSRHVSESHHFAQSSSLRQSETELAGMKI